VSVPSVATEAETLAGLTTLAVGRFDAELTEYFAQYRHPTLRTLADVVAASRILGDSVVKNLKSLEAGIARRILRNPRGPTRRRCAPG
jgi:hypothetical protein